MITPTPSFHTSLVENITVYEFTFHFRLDFCYSFCKLLFEEKRLQSLLVVLDSVV